MRELPALMPYVHLPVQSGSDRILAAMNRRHTRGDYLDVIARLRAARAGHRAHFGFHRRLSRRERRGFRGHAGAGRGRSALPAPIPSPIRRGPEHRPPIWTPRFPKPRRPSACTDCRPSLRGSNAISTHASVGRTIDVLLEKPGRLPGQLAGRTPYLQTVQVMAPRALIGSVVKVAVTELGTNTCSGTS